MNHGVDSFGPRVIGGWALKFWMTIFIPGLSLNLWQSLVELCVVSSEEGVQKRKNARQRLDTVLNERETSVSEMMCSGAHRVGLVLHVVITVLVKNVLTEVTPS